MYPIWSISVAQWQQMSGRFQDKCQLFLKMFYLLQTTNNYSLIIGQYCFAKTAALESGARKAENNAAFECTSFTFPPVFSADVYIRVFMAK